MELALTFTIGLGITVMLMVFVLVQPLVPVPVTEYVVVIVGDAITTLPVLAFKEPEGDHVNEVAPLAVNVALEPLQIDVELATTDTVGDGFTVTITVFVSVQFPFVPVTV